MPTVVNMAIIEAIIKKIIAARSTMLRARKFGSR